jgi:hypothetical protein
VQPICFTDASDDNCNHRRRSAAVFFSGLRLLRIIFRQFDWRRAEPLISPKSAEVMRAKAGLSRKAAAPFGRVNAWILDKQGEAIQWVSFGLP